MSSRVVSVIGNFCGTIRRETIILGQDLGLPQWTLRFSDFVFLELFVKNSPTLLRQTLLPRNKVLIDERR